MIRLGRALSASVSGLVLAAMSIAQTPAVPSPPPPSSPPPQQAAPESPARPTAAARDHAMEGLAAHYSRRLHGRRTASGRAFDQNAMTSCASDAAVRHAGQGHEYAQQPQRDRPHQRSGPDAIGPRDRFVASGREQARHPAPGVVPVRLEVASAPARRGPR
jgi:hypothetical protein